MKAKERRSVAKEEILGLKSLDFKFFFFLQVLEGGLLFSILGKHIFIGSEQMIHLNSKNWSSRRFFF